MRNEWETRTSGVEQKVEIVPVILGLKSQVTKFQARDALEQEITKQTGQNLGGRVMNDGSVTFGWFVRNRFFPLKEAIWKPETAKVKKLLIERDLINSFEGARATVVYSNMAFNGDFTPETMLQ